jgi:hypothetical protein
MGALLGLASKGRLTGHTVGMDGRLQMYYCIYSLIEGIGKRG